MQYKISLKWSRFIAGSTLTILILADYSSDQNLVKAVAPPSSTPIELIQKITPLQPSSGLPIRLRIPKINVDAAVEYVGLTLDGAMETPKGPTTTAWYHFGTRPGEKGSAVIDGHFGWKNNKPAVFDNLHMLQKGHKVYVEDENGVIVTFVVREVRSFDPDADAAEVFGSNDDLAHLNLITCEGVWNKASKSYSKRLVVFTDKE